MANWKLWPNHLWNEHDWWFQAKMKGMRSSPSIFKSYWFTEQWKKMYSTALMDGKCVNMHLWPYWWWITFSNPMFNPFLFCFPLAEVTVKYIRGLPHVIVPLPSRNEKCQFTLRPVSHNVGDFLQMLLAEDKGIDRAAILSEDGVRIASACSIESLMDESFWWVIYNDYAWRLFWFIVIVPMAVANWAMTMTTEFNAYL